MDYLNVELTPATLALVPVVAVILQTLKRIEAVEKLKPYFPFVGMAVAFGLIMAIGTASDNVVLASVLIGLTAAKGYDIVKKPKV